MLKASKLNGFSDLCIPYNEKQDVLIEVLKELIEGNLFYQFLGISQIFY
jgi:hypothetical protein